jgi:signal transduction histidine kinase
MIWPRSLALRLTLAAGACVVAGLGVSGWLVTGVAVRGVEAAFEARLVGLLEAAVAAATTDADGRVVLARAPAGADFERPLGGAYWQVTAPDGSVATSRSLWDQSLPAARGGHDGVLLRDAPGPRGEPLRVAERDLLLPGAAAPAHVAVALSRAETEAEVARLRALLTLIFTLLGLGLVAAVVGTVVAGLAPLRRVSRALSEVRHGRRERLAVDAPAEIAPLVAEVDALIVANRATVERARAHVGNLAHALKTPLAVLRNALDSTPADVPAAREEALALQRLVHHHLARARAAALASSTAADASPFVIAEDIAGGLRRLFDGRGLLIEVEGDPAARVQVDPQDLSEMLGNLMENACQWASRRVGVTIAAEQCAVLITIGDDGPGLPETAREAALGRGVRLDERRAGSGLGLAIAADLAALHGGGLELYPATEGGLRAMLRLPCRGAKRSD